MGSGQSKTKQQKPPEMNKQKFNFIKIVGKGGFGKVWKVTQKKTKIVYALKVMNKAKVITKKSVSSILNQRFLLSKLQPDNNKFIVNMKLSFQDNQNLYLLMDYLDGGDLRYYMNRKYYFNQQQIKFIIRCIMQGLNYIHSKNILHRDLKPQNIIVDKKGYCRITDLGVARQWRAENSHQTSGTPGYMSPQVLLRKNHSFGTDYYAVGIMAFQLFVGKRPYQGQDRRQIRQKMLAKQAKFPTNFTNISKQGIDFINRLIQRDARKRLGYNGIRQIVNHPWLVMKKQNHLKFLQQTIHSPIIPLQVSHSFGSNDTQPDQLMRQNILLLKKKQTQQLFSGYNYYPQIKKTNNLDNKILMTTQPNSQLLITLTTRQ